MLQGEALAAVRPYVFVAHQGGQQSILDSTARFGIARAGRRYGKTKVAARKLVRKTLATDRPTVNWWVANTYRNVQRGYREVLKQTPRELLAKPPPAVTAATLELQFKDGSRIEFYSAGSPDAMAGEGVGFVVADEAALWPNGDTVWNQIVRPTLMDTGGGALIISTPRGHDWFWKLWNLGQEDDQETYESWHFTTYDNPYIPREDIEEARRTLPGIIFDQEIMAEFIAAGASIFSVPEDGILGGVDNPEGQVVMGVDLGKKEDFTVISASNASTRRPCYHERFTAIRWPEQRELIRDAAEYLEASPGVEGLRVFLDSTGLGDVVFDDLEAEGLDVEPITFSGPWKERAVKLLAADLERGDAYILEDQRGEFESYAFELTPAGRYKFEAGVGHDDEVSAKLLEHWGMVNEGPPDVRLLREEHPEAALEGHIVEEIQREPDSAAEIMARPGAWH